MIKQRGIAFLHMLMVLILLLFGSIAVSHYMKVSAKKAEVIRLQQASADADEKRLLAIEQSKVIARKGGEELKAIAKIFEDDWEPANRVASVTGRIALAGPVQSLQAIYKRVNELPASSCATRGKEGMTAYMQQTINDFISFMSSSTSYGSRYGLSPAQNLEKFVDAVKTCGALERGEGLPEQLVE